MAQFRAGMQNGMMSKDLTRLGHKTKGIEIYAESWEGRIKIKCWYDNETDKNLFKIMLCKHGSNTGQVIASGELSEKRIKVIKPATFKRRKLREGN